jgi:hypothetical protein
VPLAIDNAGTITGYFDQGATLNTFVRRRDGNIRTIKYRQGAETVPAAMNSSGIIVGFYRPNATAVPTWAFARNGMHTTFFEAAGSKATYPTSINGAGEIAGYYIGPENTRIGFVRSADSTTVTFSVPDANNEGTGTPYINESGTIAGTFQDTNKYFSWKPSTFRGVSPPL